jgi:hypothetical protein
VLNLLLQPSPHQTLAARTSMAPKTAPTINPDPVMDKLRIYSASLRTEIGTRERVDLFCNIHALAASTALPFSTLPNASNLASEVFALIKEAEKSIFTHVKQSLAQSTTREYPSKASHRQPFPAESTGFDPEKGTSAEQRTAIARSCLNDLFTAVKYVDVGNLLQHVHTVLLVCTGQKFQYVFEEDGDEEDIPAIELDDGSVSAKWRADMFYMADVAIVEARLRPAIPSKAAKRRRGKGPSDGQQA